MQAEDRAARSSRIQRFSRAVTAPHGHLRRKWHAIVRSWRDNRWTHAACPRHRLGRRRQVHARACDGRAHGPAGRDLDLHYWRAGWRDTPEAEWLTRVDALLAEERWILEGNYSGTLDRRLAACDTVVFLDLPRVVCLYRVPRRRLRYRGRSRPDLPTGCPERVTWEFLRWIWTYPRKRRPKVLAKLPAPGRRVVVLRSAAECTRFLDSLA